MSRGRRIDDILQPLTRQSNQYFLGNGLHTLGLLGWILSQTGRADVWVSTFSTSDAFCSGFLNLRKKGLIGKASLVADLKASRKTIQLAKLMSSCFDNVYLAQNHSKIVLVQNERWTVSVISSQNQTYGDRAECTMVTTSQQAFLDLYTGLDNIIKKVAITAREIREDVLMPYSQTYGSFNLPVEALELLAWGDPVGIVLNNNPINAYCLCNCVIDEDRLENKKPIKVSQFRKIDGAITMLMTLGLMSTYER